jgi:mannose-6-phosphate isomerase-like protein (cupin superfamily)
MSDTPVIRPQDRAEFWTPERCFITELLNDPRMPEASLARARVEPGVTTALHSLDVEETYVIETGEGLMQVGEARFPVTAGDSVRIAEGLPQRITNTGPGDLVFLCLCRPRFRPEGYTDLETLAAAAPIT